ncbi:HAMP domain-containing sensor histidine kinase [Cytophagales bacterium LB-30]|uniref:histidine kinase n=1 Tax=Shiella aurantiaca TaxID=3058365 RepID=A0ABT8F4E7_9BACT|nr:HAMP domain-containing sensor histidine kinase [Shiella aurantiaca]MDN4165101.1 HAMP domain-containing sensor histidine kinase [Shiella aurantiaca]
MKKQIMLRLAKLYHSEWDSYVSAISYRYGTALAAIILILFGLVDALLIKNSEALRLTLYVRYIFIIPLMSISIALSYRKDLFENYHKITSMIAGLAALCGIVIMLKIAVDYNEPNFDRHFAALVMAVSFSSLILWLNLFTSSFLFVIVLIFYAILVGHNEKAYHHYGEFIGQMLILGTACSLGTYVRYAFNLLMRNNYSKTIALRNEKKELQSVNEKLSRADELKLRIISVLSHDVQGPIRNIQAVFKLFYAKDISQKELMGLVQNIDTTLRSTQILIDDVLSWAEVSLLNTSDTSAGQLPIHELIDSVICLYQYSALEKNITFEKQVVGNFYISNKQDIVRFVLRNLLNNAVKFTENGKIIIRVLNREGRLYIDVADSGIGMSDDLISRLFKSIKGVSNKGTRGEIGKGIGLYLCKQLLTENGGNITFFSKFRKGTTFMFNLPVDCKIYDTNSH